MNNSYPFCPAPAARSASCLYQSLSSLTQLISLTPPFGWLILIRPQWPILNRPVTVTTELYANLLNIGNLMNDEWGLVEEIPFSYRRAVAGTTLDAASSQYVYTFTPTTLNLLPVSVDGVSNTSRWQLSVGLRVRF